MQWHPPLTRSDIKLSYISKFSVPEKQYTNRTPAYGVFVSQLTRYARAFSSYGCFILGETRPSNKLLEQGYVITFIEEVLLSIRGSFSRTFRYFSGLCSSNIPWYFLDFARDLVTKWDFIYRLWANRRRLLLRTPGSFPFWDLHVHVF